MSAPTSVSSLRRTMTQPALDELRLSHILNGETCPPISFPDFAAFVTHKEYTTENLLFVIWYRSYRSRWDALPEAQRRSVPLPSDRLADRYAPFAYLDKALADGVVHSRTTFVETMSWTADGQRPTRGEPAHDHTKQGQSNWSLFNKASTSTSATDSSTEVKPILHPSLLPQLPPAGTDLAEPADQPMRDEALRAFSTFLRKGGSRELGISDELRIYTKTCLRRSSAPDCFLPVFEEIYQAVETQSLPHFLGYAKTNINRPKKMFWYYVGAIDLFIGTLIFVFITLFVYRRNFGYRLLRLPSTFFSSFGAMQMYSAYRGFCTQVWGRTSRQVRPWEMDDVAEDEEAPASSLNIWGNQAGVATDLRPVESGETILTPVSEKTQRLGTDITLSPEVHPLADVSGMIQSPSTEPPWSVPTLGKDEISEVQRRHLAIRRETIKLPAAELVFPIPDSPISTSTFSASTTAPASSVDSRKRSQILSDYDSPEPTPTLSPPSAPIFAPTSPSLPQSAPSCELNTLLSKFRRAEPMDPGAYREAEQERERKAKTFGPETLVEDPRVAKLMESIIRDILLVGAATGLVWVALCFAVPMAGLA